MENDFSLDSARLEGALRRAAEHGPVPPAPEPVEKPDEVATLEKFIGRAAGAGRLYGVLALKMAGTRAHRELLLLADSERDTEKALQTEHLLLTGDTAPVPGTRVSVLFLIKALRDAYAAELKNAGAYDREGARLPDCALSRLYRRLAARERLHAATLRRILERTIY